MRGFISGLVWGLVLVVIGVAALSVMSPLAPTPELTESQPEPMPVAKQEAEPPVVESAEKAPEVAETTPATSERTTPAPDDLTKVESSDTAPAAQPEVADTALQPESPATVPAAIELDDAASDDSPNLPAGGGQAPAAPAEDVAVSAEFEAPLRPEAPSVRSAADGLAMVAAKPGTPPAIVASPDAAPTTGSVPVAVAAQTALDAVPAASTKPAPLPVAKPAPAPVKADPVTEDAPAPPVAVEQPKPEIAALPQTAPTPADDQPVADIPDPTPPTPPASPAPKVTALPQAGAATNRSGPTIGKRVVPLTERHSRVQKTPAPAAAPDNPDLPPLQRYAAAFANPENKPLMSIVLIDDETSIGVEALSEFPYPLAFAIDPTAEGAAEKMARHRASGFEVLALIDLPSVATAQDAEVSLAASFDTLSEAVAVLEGTGTGIQGNRNLSEQVAAFVQSTGRGMVTQDSGLNTVLKLALRDGVPAGVVFRDFDSEQQDPVVMRRFLDKAVFRAAQDGSVIMMGRVRPDTISALLLWGLQDRASRVALAPVSAVLSQSVSSR